MWQLKLTQALALPNSCLNLTLTLWPNYYIMSPTLLLPNHLSLHSIVSQAYAWSLLKLAASVQLLLQSCWWCFLLLLSCLCQGVLPSTDWRCRDLFLRVPWPVLEGAVTLREPWPVLRVLLSIVEKVPLPIEVPLPFLCAEKECRSSRSLPLTCGEGSLAA